jgi:predicted DNA-binding transcriptional regulator AlpA
MPGAYKLKRGHWRVRDCPAFRDWLVRVRVESKLPGFAESSEKFTRGLQNPTAYKRLAGRELLPVARLPHIVKLKARSAWGDVSHRIFGRSIDLLPRKWRQLAEGATDKMVDVMVATGELSAKGQRLTARNVAAFLKVSRATFYRLGLDGELRRCLRVLPLVSEKPTLPAKKRNTVNYNDELKRKGGSY